MIVYISCIAVITTIFLLYFSHFIGHNFDYKIAVQAILYLTIIKYSLHFIAPIFLGIGNEFFLILRSPKYNSLVFDLYLYEFIQILFWSFGLLAITYREKIKKSCSNSFQNNGLAVLIILFIIERLIIYFSYKGYINEYIDLVFKPFMVLARYSGPPAIIILLFNSYKLNNKRYLIISIAGLLSLILFLNSRASIFYGVFFSLFIIYKNKNKLALYLIISMMVVLLPLQNYYGGYLNVNIDRLLKAPNLTSLFNPGNIDQRKFVDEVEWRVGALVRYSINFINLYDEGKSAGISPIFNSAVGIVPRYFSPDKPQPAALIENDLESRGEHIIYKEEHGYDKNSMVEYSTAAHAYWEFGIYGVIISGLISGIFIGLCVILFSKFNLLGLALLIGVFKPWGLFDTKIILADIFTQFYQYIIPACVFIFLLNLFHKNE